MQKGIVAISRRVHSTRTTPIDAVQRASIQKGDTGIGAGWSLVSVDSPKVHGPAVQRDLGGKGLHVIRTQTLKSLVLNLIILFPPLLGSLPLMSSVKV